MKSMLKSDFDVEVKIHGYEVFTAEQVKNYTQQAHDSIEKSISGDKSEAWKEVATEVRSFTPVQLTDDDTLQKSIVFYREAQVIWDKAEGDDISKARSGIYANTAENRKLGRVGRKYGEKKADDEKGKGELKYGEKAKDTEKLDMNLNINDSPLFKMEGRGASPEAEAVLNNKWDHQFNEGGVWFNKEKIAKYGKKYDIGTTVKSIIDYAKEYKVDLKDTEKALVDIVNGKKFNGAFPQRKIQKISGDKRSNLKFSLEFDGEKQKDITSLEELFVNLVDFAAYNTDASGYLEDN